MGASYFTEETFAFLRDLRANNDRDWFKKNRDRYERDVTEPAARFIMDFEPKLHGISEHYLADPRTVGGSLFRIHRDSRFSKDKTAYMTHSGIRFPHAWNKVVHAPGFYLHFDPEGSFVGLGVWHPDNGTLRMVRDAIVENPAAWKRTRDGKRFRARYDLGGDSLQRAPRGYDPEHPFVADLKRKDFIASCAVPAEDLTDKRFLARFTEACQDGAPFMKYLCTAMNLPF
jgi:uncharacterized protein (TIGR02453 family)